MNFCLIGLFFLLLVFILFLLFVVLSLSPHPARPSDTVRLQARHIKQDTLRHMRHIANELNEDIINQTRRHKH